LLDLVADYADAPGEKRLRKLRNETSPRLPPAWDSNGRALAMLGHGEYSLYADGAWQPLPKLEHRTNATGLSFGEEGRPRVTVSSGDNLLDDVWEWSADAGWQNRGTTPSRYAQRSEAARGPSED